MASPFSIFRRNQRIMIAVLGVMAMVAFIFLDPIFRMLGGTRGPSNTVVVKTNYGNYRAAELAALRQQRGVARNFLQRVIDARVRKAVDDKLLPEQQAQMRAQQMYDFWYGRLMGRAQPAGDAAAIETVILAKRAEEQGIVVTDRTVNNMLKMITEDMLSAADLQQIIAGLKPDGRTSVGQVYLFDALRREIAASTFAQMFRIGTIAIPPGQRWDYFEELNLRADAQVMPVAAEQFLKDVPEPSNETLEKFFERYQNQIQEPNCPIPGFKQPRKAAFQYFKANIDDFMQRAREKVTPEEMHEYYEKNKAFQFRELTLPGAKAGETQPAEGPAGLENPTPGEGDDKEPAAEPKAQGEDSGATPDSNPSTPDQSSTPKPANGEQPSDAKPARRACESRRVARQAPGESRARATSQGCACEQKDLASRADYEASPFRLASDAKKTSPAAKTAASEKVTPDPATSSQAAAGKPAADQPESEKDSSQSEADDKQPADKKPSDKNAPAPAEGTEAKTPAAGQPGSDVKEGNDTKGESKEGEKKAEPKYEPFEKVEKAIRDALARDKAQTMIEESFNRLKAKMREYSSAYNAYKANKEENPDQEPPPPIDFAELARQEGVTAHETEPLSAYEALTETDLGKSFSFILDARLGFPRVSFVQLAYSDSHLLRPETTEDNENNRYLWWKIKDVPETVPSFEEVRSQVLHAFKLQQARELALKKAEAYAKEARAAKQPLKEVFAGHEGLEVIETGPFTRMTLGNLPYDPESTEPRLSDVHGVAAPGEDFMNAVFNSSPGQVKVAFNRPQTVAFVVQVQNFEPARDQLEHEFILEPFQKYATLAEEQKRQLYLAWITEIEQQAGVEWIEPPRGDSRAE